MTQGAATRYAPLPAKLTLHAGGVLPNGRVAFETFGVVDRTGERTILLFTGLSASAARGVRSTPITGS